MNGNNDGKTADLRKKEELKKCLLSAQRLGMDLAGLFSLSLNLSPAEKQFAQVALSHLERIYVNLNSLYPKTGQAERREEKPKRPRPHGSLKL